MYMKRYISFLGLAAILSGCAAIPGSSNGGELDRCGRYGLGRTHSLRHGTRKKRLL